MKRFQNQITTFFLFSTITTIASGFSVAILGSGIAGSTAARQLAEAGAQVTVFECGRAAGGRTSTRTTRDDDFRFQFDHGAQYIGTPKTKQFQQTLLEWEAAGFVREWRGRFGSVGVDNGNGDEESSVSLEVSKRRYVGYPAMNSICLNLLQHKNIDTVLQTRACAVFDNHSKRWKMSSHGDDDRCDLGEFDWLVSTDRLSATNNRADLRNAPPAVDAFKHLVSSIENVPSLTLMVVFESSLDGIPLDGIEFGGDSPSLAWAARDSSKPGRERSDGRECWVVQSGHGSAERVLAEIAADGNDFSATKRAVAEKAKEILLADFLNAMGKLQTTGSIPSVVYAMGHRWSAAFPKNVPTEDDQTKEEANSFYANEAKDFYLDDSTKFVACGDYLGQLTGRIEGAYLSGKRTAMCLVLKECSSASGWS